MSLQPEPWLRGVIDGHHAIIGHLFRSSEQIQEDATRALEGLSAEQLWRQLPGEAASVGFHARHLAGSTQRLCAYLEGRQLTQDEIEAIAREAEPGAASQALESEIRAVLARYEALIKGLQPGDFETLRHVGRKRLPVTAIGLAIHIAEHGQRHAAQALTTARIVRAGC